jgi:hypothetical protein
MPQPCNLLLQPARLGLGDIALLVVGAVQRPQITRDAGVDLLHPPADLGNRVILVAVVHRFELAAVDRNNGTGEEFEPTAKLDKLHAHRSDRCAIVPAEVSNRLEVGRQPPGQPHQLNVALRFAFQPPARLHTVQVAVEVNPSATSKNGRQAGPSPPGGVRKPQGGKVELVDENLDHPNGVLLADIFFQAVREQRPLQPIFAIDKPMHRQAPKAQSLGILRQLHP